MKLSIRIYIRMGIVIHSNFIEGKAEPSLQFCNTSWSNSCFEEGLQIKIKNHSFRIKFQIQQQMMRKDANNRKVLQIRLKSPTWFFSCLFFLAPLPALFSHLGDYDADNGDPKKQTKGWCLADNGDPKKQTPGWCLANFKKKKTLRSHTSSTLLRGLGWFSSSLVQII